jgi:NADPH2:quinone reductase
MTVSPLCGVLARIKLWTEKRMISPPQRGRQFAPQGLDAVLLTAGGEGAEKALLTLRPGGRAAYPNGVQPIPKERAGIKIQSYDGEYAPPPFEKLNRLLRDRCPIAIDGISQPPRAGGEQVHPSKGQ